MPSPSPKPSAPRAGGAPVPRRAGRSPRALAVFLAVLASMTAADLLSKQWAFDALSDAPGQSTDVIDGLLRLSLSTNPGIVFGLRVAPWAVAAATALAVVAVVAMFVTSPPAAHVLHAALAMVLAGALGNSYDRLNGGVVRDFIDIRIPGLNYHWPTFNVADILLVVGVALVLLLARRAPAEP